MKSLLRLQSKSCRTAFSWIFSEPLGDLDLWSAAVPIQSLLPLSHPLWFSLTCLPIPLKRTSVGSTGLPENLLISRSLTELHHQRHTNRVSGLWYVHFAKCVRRNHQAAIPSMVQNLSSYSIRWIWEGFKENIKLLLQLKKGIFP